MEMGTGKSRTAIEMAVRRRALDRCRRVLWFCPVSLKETIRQEILKHTGESAHVFDDKTEEGRIPEAFWHVIGIESMSASVRVICAAGSLAGDKVMCIVDESSYIKGHRAARTRWITEVGRRCRYRLLLTGTPISQGIEDLFSQMRFLDEKILGYRSFYSFAANHLEYSDRFPGMVVRALNTEWVAAKIAPYVYQVTKEECLDLPGKLFSSRWFRMTSTQRYYYELAKAEVFEDILDDDPYLTQLAIFRLFNALQQITCGFWRRRLDDGTLDEIEFDENPRQDFLLEIIAEIPPDEKVIIWSKFRRDVRAIAGRLGDDAVTFYGGQTLSERDAAIREWRESKRFFIATPDCGGHGLTLNEARYVIFYNNQFKYSSRLQAEDRNHRIGQQHAVTYIDVACSQSIDERILNALAKKGNAAEEFRQEVQRMREAKTIKQAIKAL